MNHKETANGYLGRIAKAAIVRNKTKQDIERSVSILTARIKEYFKSEIKGHLSFGSYTRKTMLPRCMDAQSDVDIMVIFQTHDITPKAYLNRLRRFAECNYTRHEIVPSHPTIMLELNHIRFELVPAIVSERDHLLIPAKTTEMEDWKTTDPHSFMGQLRKKNGVHSQQILPLIRIMKYWNILHGRPFRPFDLEQAIIKTGYRSSWSLWFGGKWDLLSYIHQFTHRHKPNGKIRIDALNKLRTAMTEIDERIKDGDHDRAVILLKQCIPHPNQ